MAEKKIVAATSRQLTDEEATLIAWFKKQEAASVDNLEAGARQIIVLVTTFMSIVLGALALGKDKFDAVLRLPWVGGTGIITLGLLLAALLAALVVVLPFAYRYRGASLDDKRRTYQRITRTKSRGLLVAAVFFWFGMLCSACMVLGIVVGR